MKKNLISVLILVLVLANLIVTAVLLITVLPQTKKANDLIDKVAEAIDLELTSGDIVSNANRVALENIEVVDISEAMTITLKDSGDGVTHYAVLNVAISLDTSSEGYATYGATFATKESLVKSAINAVVSGFTIDEMRTNAAEAQDQILLDLQDIFGSDLVVGVNFTGATYQ